ncbi:MAG: Asp-tRNA(Asn)/Glu-tRNA(Gln) amidotransferase subunit GatC [Candidatus Omnitrophota bacterium]|nr:MAG: Asp-tRNA(Asn)/Glu-tRNA(Gln) amidotransferase subunit GatC [Candidatus Omnitrophota bacterium]
MDIEYVAKLARIELNKQEKKRLSTQLGDILAYIEKLKELNISSVEPMSHVLPLKNVFRRDEVRPSLPQEKVLANAPHAAGNNFSVPRIIE